MKETNDNQEQQEPAWMTSCRLRGETVYTKDGTYNPIKSASVEPKEGPEEEPQLSSWARLRTLGSAN
jgi:hypothetical protein